MMINYKKSAMNFFINGMFDCRDGQYWMRFLCDHEHLLNSKISIVIMDHKGLIIQDQCILLKKDLGVELIEVQICDPQLETCQTYFKYYYNLNIDDLMIFNGSFPLIKENDQNAIKFGFVSCNDNLTR